MPCSEPGHGNIIGVRSVNIAGPDLFDEWKVAGIKRYETLDYCRRHNRVAVAVK